MQNYRGLAEVHGGDFPAQLWSDFMSRALALGDPELVAGCSAFDPPTNFDGNQFGIDLSTTTLPECAAVGPSQTSIVDLGGGATSIANLAPPTTEPCAPPTTLPGDTTTTAPGETTTTTAPGGSTTVTTVPPATTAPPTTAAPTETTAGDG
jgi:hypothetical protein